MVRYESRRMEVRNEQHKEMGGKISFVESA